MSSPAAVALLQEIEQQKKNGIPEKNLVSIVPETSTVITGNGFLKCLNGTRLNALNENIYFIFSGALKRIMYRKNSSAI